jgi:hypothetical protein
MKMPQRKMVKEKDYTISSTYDFANTLEELCLLFTNLKERFGPAAKVCVDWRYDDCDIYIEYERPETDAEMNKRLATEKKKRERAKVLREKKMAKAREVLFQKEADERRLYEELKAKFEGK